MPLWPLPGAPLCPQTSEGQLAWPSSHCRGITPRPRCSRKSLAVEFFLDNVAVCMSRWFIYCLSLSNHSFGFLLGGGVPCCVACRILVPRPGIEPVPPAVEARNLNRWTAREVPTVNFLYKFNNQILYNSNSDLS